VQPFTERCPAYDVTRGRCQLIDSHPEPHAMAVSDAYMTWHDKDVRQWTQDAPPSWLIDLAWVPGFQPAISGRDSPGGSTTNPRS
jgi:hypothetical protein